jgi:hypothetical protein
VNGATDDASYRRISQLQAPKPKSVVTHAT